MKMKGGKVLFIDTTHPYLFEELLKLGFACDYFPGITREECFEIIPEYTGLIIRSRFTLDRMMLERGTGLRFIARVGAGMENIDTDYALIKGIKCFNAPEGNRDALGEHTLGMLLVLMNKLFIADQEVRNGIWRRKENRGVELMGKTVGIIGYGNMGSAFARRLMGFEADVIAYDKYKFNYSDECVRETILEDLMERSDIVSLHVPLTEETTYMVDDAFINRFRKNIFMINTARGKVVRTSDLIKNLKSGKVLGAALDVLEYEDISYEKLNLMKLTPEFNELTGFNNVIFTPHIAGWSIESNLKLAMVIIDKLKKAFNL